LQTGFETSLDYDFTSFQYILGAQFCSFCDSSFVLGHGYPMSVNA